MTIQTTTNGDLHEEVTSDERTSHSICPHLGLVDDAETWLAFPAGGNYCHHADPPEAIALDHQSSHCLSGKYTECPAFQQKMGAPLPAALRAAEQAPENRRGVLVAAGLGVVAVVALVLFLGAWLRDGDPAGIVSLPATATPSPTTPVPTASPDPGGAAAPAVSTSTATPSPTATAVPPTATGTATPTATATPSPLPSSTPVPNTPTPVLPQAVVTVVQLNVRAGPGTNYAVIDQVPEGSRLAITGQNSGGGWWRVCCVGGGEQEGWVFGETVAVEGSTEAVPVIQNIPLPPATPES